VQVPAKGLIAWAALRGAWAARADYSDRPEPFKYVAWRGLRFADRTGIDEARQVYRPGERPGLSSKGAGGASSSDSSRSITGI
jgi:hypothetical protein